MMFRDESEKQLKYAIRKKKTGGGAASFVIGSVIFGGMMLGTMTANADTVATNDTSNDAVTNQTGTDSTADATTTLKATTTPVATASSEGNSESTAAAATNENTTSTKPVNTATTSEATSKVETASSTSEVASSQADSTSTASEEASSAVANTNDKLQTSETSTPQASGTDLTRRAIAAENNNTNVNNKVNITNVTFNKDEVVESEGTDINISFDWEAQGLHKGDTMVVPMFKGFDSVTKEVKYNFSSDSLSNMGTLVLNYNEHKIYVEYTGDIDPNKIYRGTMNIGTFVSRNYFENEKNEAQINIPLPDGTSISKTLKVNFDQAKEWDDAYAAAINETLSEDKTRADVSWVVEVNPKKMAMKSTAVYITPDNIDKVEPFYVDGKSQSAIYYTSAQNPYTLDPGSIMVYEANITPSLGYTKGKKLVLGTDYEILRGAYDANTGSQKDNVWIVRFKGKYDVINGDQFVIEYNTHYDNLDPTLKSTTGDRAVAIGTDVNVNNVVTYFKPNLDLGGGIIYANVKLIDSSITSVEGENITGSVIVAHINGKTGEYLKPEAYVINGGTTLKDVKQGTPYTTSPETFDGFTFTRMGYDSAPVTGTVNNSVQRVVYVYMPDELKGSVDVKYVDRATGEVLPFAEAALTTVKDNAPAGEKYDTDKKDFAGYTFVGMTEDSAAADGNVEANKTLHVIYAYDKKPEPVVERGSVDVVYVDEQGNVLPGGELTDVKKDDPVGEKYTTEQKAFNGYTFKRMGTGSAAANGKVTKGVQHVIYVYTKNPEAPKTGSVDVKFVDKTTGEMITGTGVETVKDGAPVGEGYFTTPKDLTKQGYQYVGIREGSDDPAGLVAEGTKHVVYEYEKIPEPIMKKGSVDVKYVDRATGEVLPFADAALTTVKDNAPEGEGYNTTKKNFAGYTFTGLTEDSAAANGSVVADKTLHVVYAYDKNPEPVVEKGSVDVVYVDEQGNVLPGGELTDVKKDAPVGEAYTTEQKNFDGYTFSRMGTGSAGANGKVTEGVQHVVYVYTKNPEPVVEQKGSVDVKYVTIDGKVLEDVSTVKDNAPVGEEYTTDEKSFDGYHFVGMDKTSDSANGKVTEGTKHVIYVYEKDPETPAEVEKKGSVTVTYVDKDGNPLPGGEEKTVKDNAPVGEEYTTEQKDFSGYHFVGMDKHSDPVDGKVTEETKHVIYVYEKNPTPTVATDKEEEQKGSVTVTYVDKDGNPLPGGEETTVKHDVPVGEDYTTEEKDFPGYHFVGMDKTSDPANGKVTEGTKHVIYVYEKDPTPTVATDKSEEKKGSVDVKYVDTEGNVLEGPNSVVKDGLVGSDYNTSGKTFAGYKLIGMELGSASANGKVVEGTLHVIYLYQKVTADVLTAPTATSETPTVNKVQPSVTASVTPSAAQPKSEKQASTQVALPQTGETKQNSSMLGVIALGVAGMLGLGFKKEEKENK